jgi:hypothetical protein
VGLVQMGLGMQQQGRLGFQAASRRVLQRLGRTLEGVADLADHPGQGTGVERGRGGFDRIEGRDEEWVMDCS